MSLYQRVIHLEAIAEFDAANILTFSSLISEVLRKCCDRYGRYLTSEGSILLLALQGAMPDREVEHYWYRLRDKNLPDTLLNLYNYVELKRFMITRKKVLHEKKISKRNLRTLYGQDAAEAEEHETYYGGAEEQETQVPPTAGPEVRGALKKQVTFATCPCCGGSHGLFKCEEFKMKTLPVRYAIVRKKRVCFRCLREGHGIAACDFRPGTKCGLEGCDKDHHQLLHPRRATGYITYEQWVLQSEFDDEDHAFIQANHVITLYIKDELYVAIRTVTLWLVGPNGFKRRILAALDSCSNSTNIDKDTAHEMCLKVLERGVHRKVHFMTQEATIESNIVSFVLMTLDGLNSYEVKAHTIDSLVAGTPVVDWHRVAEDHPYLKNADPPKPDIRDKVSVLLGTDFAHLMSTNRSIYRGSDEPIAERTKLGWAFSGPVKHCRIVNGNTFQTGAATLTDVTNAAENLGGVGL